MNEMQAIDIARRMAELGQQKEACQAYTLAMAGNQKPEELFEAALYILQFGGNYQVAYDALLKLCTFQDFAQDAFGILTEAFYQPNEKQLKTRYEKNCKLLKKYPYLFRQDFPAFEDLPIRFYPYDDHSYVPYDARTECFSERVNFNHPQITHYFFKDLEKPILAEDIFSQYELGYLYDNVRASEDIGRENHIYLHYTSWQAFCAHLQVLNLRPLLEKKKIVFLMEQEISRYPIDFQKEFHIDYSQYELKPPALDEFNKLIWHTQLSSDNGGDFFNEVFDGHPNLLMMHSIMLFSAHDFGKDFKEHVKGATKVKLYSYNDEDAKIKRWIIGEMTEEELSTEKGQFISLFLSNADCSTLDIHSRISPVMFFQPHFYNPEYDFIINQQNRAVLHSKAYEDIQKSPVFKQFRYLKTFTPMRRITTSGAATVRFQLKSKEVCIRDSVLVLPVVGELMMDRIENRSYMVDWQDRLFQDSVLVRFEDGKLNPRATFTALAEFLDLPYTESMTYCSKVGERDPESEAGNARGFSTDVVYRTYDEFLGKPERYLMEYFLRDAYEYYGYGFQVYDGKPMTMEDVKKKLSEITVLDDHMERTAHNAIERYNEFIQDPENLKELEEKKLVLEDVEELVKNRLTYVKHKRLHDLELLLRNPRFLNKNGQPLNFMPMLKLDPELLEQPIYH